MQKPVDIREPTSVDFRDHSGHQALLLMACPSASPWKQSGKSRIKDVAEIDILHHPGNSSKERNGDASRKHYYTIDTSTDVVSSISEDYILESTSVLPHNCWMQERYAPSQEESQQSILQSGAEYHKIGLNFTYWDAYEKPEEARWTIPLEQRLRKHSYRVLAQHSIAFSEKDKQQWADIARLFPHPPPKELTKLRVVLKITGHHDFCAPRAKNLDLTSSQTLSGVIESLTATL